MSNNEKEESPIEVDELDEKEEDVKPKSEGSSSGNGVPRKRVCHFSPNA
jgi:hypothetical protein